jgi:hypothetical protein
MTELGKECLKPSSHSAWEITLWLTHFNVLLDDFNEESLRKVVNKY